MRIWTAAVLTFAVCSTPLAARAAPLTFEEIARELSDDIGFFDAEPRVALSEDGTVVFAGFDGPGAPKLFASDGGAITVIDLSPYELESVTSIAVDASGHVAFIADRPSDRPGAPAWEMLRGVHRVSTTGGAVTTLYEGVLGAFAADELPLPPSSNVALSSLGILSFSTIEDGAGALYRSPITSSVAVLRAGSGIFYNNRGLDVNDAGQVTIEMEYADPTRGLSRGVLLFDAPAGALDDIDTAVEKMGVGASTKVAINALGQVAFSINGPQTLTFYDPPNDATGSVIATITLAPGVYVATPTPFGEPPMLEQRASASGAFATFHTVDINEEGVVVFEASTDTGGYGIFRGSHPVLDKIVAVGDVRGDVLFSWVKLGALNDAGQLTLMTSDYRSTDRQVWRVDGVERRRWPFWPWIWLRRWLELWR